MSNEGRTIVHMATVPITFGFFEGHFEHLRSRGWTVALIASGGDGELAAVSAGHADYHVAVEMRRNIAPLSDIRSLWQLIHAVRSIRPTVLHAYTPKAGLLGPIAARFVRASARPAVLVSIFGLPQMTQSGAKRRLLNYTTRVSSRLADKVWCDSPSMARYVVESGLAPARKVVVLGRGSVSGVDSARRFNPDLRLEDGRRVRSALGIEASAVVVIFVGRVNADKGINELAEAWRLLSSQRGDIRLVVVGPHEVSDGRTQAALEWLNGSPSVSVLGRRTDIPALLAAADIFAMPSYREGFGVSNLEASSMRLPVVATRIPGCVDSVADGITGTLVPPRDAEILARAIESYIVDAHLRLAHGTAGRRRAVEDFPPEGISEELEQLYVSMVVAR